MAGQTHQLLRLALKGKCRVIGSETGKESLLNRQNKEAEPLVL